MYLLCEPTLASRPRNTVYFVYDPCLVTPGAYRVAAEREIIIVRNPPDRAGREFELPEDETLAHRLDATLLSASATPEQVRMFAGEAAVDQVAAVCVNPAYVPLVSDVVSGLDVGVCTVVGFPLGATATRIKVAEASLAVEQGATEIDLVMAIGLAKAGDWDGVAQDIREVRQAVPGPGTILKVIVEASALSYGELERAAQTAVEAGADFVKTGTGTAGGVRKEDVIHIARAVGNRARVKAAGGIRDLQTAMTLLDLGAHRLGTSAASALIEEARRLVSG